MSHRNVPHHQCHSIHYYFCATAISKKDLSSTGHCWYLQTSLETLRHLTTSFIFNSRRLIHTFWSRVKVNLGFFLKKYPSILSELHSVHCGIETFPLLSCPATENKKYSNTENTLISIYIHTHREAEHMESLSKHESKEKKDWKVMLTQSPSL